MRMPIVASIFLLASALSSLAASVTVSDTSTVLPGVAQSTTAILVDAGLKPKSSGGGNFVVEAKNFHCDQRNNGALDASDVHGGLPTMKCRINSKNVKGTTKGKLFGDQRALTDLLGKIESSSASGGASFGDCAMGYCGTFAKSITCTINTTIENFNNGGRWSCTYVDGQ